MEEVYYVADMLNFLFIVAIVLAIAVFAGFWLLEAFGFLISQLITRLFTRLFGGDDDDDYTGGGNVVTP